MDRRKRKFPATVLVKITSKAVQGGRMRMAASLAVAARLCTESPLGVFTQKCSLTTQRMTQRRAWAVEMLLWNTRSTAGSAVTRVRKSLTSGFMPYPPGV
jgi:hypothetical protein